MIVNGCKLVINDIRCSLRTRKENDIRTVFFDPVIESIFDEDIFYFWGDLIDFKKFWTAQMNLVKTSGLILASVQDHN